MIMGAGLVLRAATAVFIAMSCGVSAAWGQWTVGVELGADRFWGGSVENGPERRSFRPYRPTTFGGALERRSGRGGVGIRLLYTEASLALEGNDAVVAAKGVSRSTVLRRR